MQIAGATLHTTYIESVISRTDVVSTVRYGRRMNQPKVDAVPAPDPELLRESQQETVSKPGGFKNDPDEPTNPDEVIERSRRAIRERLTPERE